MRILRDGTHTSNEFGNSKGTVPLSDSDFTDPGSVGEGVAVPLAVSLSNGRDVK